MFKNEQPRTDYAYHHTQSHKPSRYFQQGRSFVPDCYPSIKSLKVWMNTHHETNNSKEHAHTSIPWSRARERTVTINTGFWRGASGSHRVIASFPDYSKIFCFPDWKGRRGSYFSPSPLEGCALFDRAHVAPTQALQGFITMFPTSVCNSGLREVEKCASTLFLYTVCRLF